MPFFHYPNIPETELVRVDRETPRMEERREEMIPRVERKIFELDPEEAREFLSGPPLPWDEARADFVERFLLNPDTLSNEFFESVMKRIPGDHPWQAHLRHGALSPAVLYEVIESEFIDGVHSASPTMTSLVSTIEEALSCGLLHRRGVLDPAIKAGSEVELISANPDRGVVGLIAEARRSLSLGELVTEELSPEIFEHTCEEAEQVGLFTAKSFLTFFDSEDPHVWQGYSTYVAHLREELSRRGAIFGWQEGELVQRALDEAVAASLLIQNPVSGLYQFNPARGVIYLERLERGVDDSLDADDKTTV